MRGYYETGKTSNANPSLCARCQNDLGTLSHGVMLRGDHVSVCRECGQLYEDLMEAQKESARCDRVALALLRDWESA